MTEGNESAPPVPPSPSTDGTSVSTDRTSRGDGTDGAASLQQRGRKAWTWVPVAFVLAGLIIAVFIALKFLDRASNDGDPLSSLEQAFFGAYTLVVGAAISWLLTHYYAQRETREQFKQLARPALRRVMAARESADLLLAAIDRRRRQSTDLEPYRSLRELVEQHARVLDDAIEDWREVLPVEAELAQKLVRSTTRDEAAFARVEDRFEEIEALIATTSTPGDAEARIVELRNEIATLRKELRDRPRYSALGYGLDGVQIGNSGLGQQTSLRLGEINTG